MKIRRAFMAVIVHRRTGGLETDCVLVGLEFDVHRRTGGLESLKN